MRPKSITLAALIAALALPGAVQAAPRLTVPRGRAAVLHYIHRIYPDEISPSLGRVVRIGPRLIRYWDTYTVPSPDPFAGATYTWPILAKMTHGRVWVCGYVCPDASNYSERQ